MNTIILAAPSGLTGWQVATVTIIIVAVMFITILSMSVIMELKFR